MGGNGTDEHTRFAIERLLAPGDGWRALVRELVARCPDDDPLDLVLALIDAAAAIESNFGPGSHAHEAVAHGYRCAALLALDLAVMQRLGRRCGKASDLSAYWQTDPYFLHL
jgi:hypothetical protein